MYDKFIDVSEEVINLVLGDFILFVRAVEQRYSMAFFLILKQDIYLLMNKLAIDNLCILHKGYFEEMRNVKRLKSGINTGKF